MGGCEVRELIPGRVFQVCDAVATFPEPLTQALPDPAPALPDLAPARPGATPARPDPIPADTTPPDTTPADTWVLHAHCYLILAEQGPVLVDTGIGPGEGPAGRWLSVAGRLPEVLPTTGVSLGDITTVVLTHAHLDHVGWNVLPAGPTFPNATYLIQQDDLDHSRSVSRDPAGAYATQVRPLVEAGVLCAVDGRHRLDARLELTRTPGHSPGHQSLAADFGAAGRVFFAGDTFVHPVQISNPIRGYAHEADQSRAGATRMRILAEAAHHPFLLAPAHLSHPVPLPMS